MQWDGKATLRKCKPILGHRTFKSQRKKLPFSRTLHRAAKNNIEQTPHGTRSLPPSTGHASLHTVGCFWREPSVCPLSVIRTMPGKQALLLSNQNSVPRNREVSRRSLSFDGKCKHSSPSMLCASFLVDKLPFPWVMELLCLMLPSGSSGKLPLRYLF